MGGNLKTILIDQVKYVLRIFETHQTYEDDSSEQKEMCNEQKRLGINTACQFYEND